MVADSISSEERAKPYDSTTYRERAIYSDRTQHRSEPKRQTEPLSERATTFDRSFNKSEQEQLT